MKPLIVFDIDGTLTNTVKIDDFCFTETIKNLYSVALGDADWNHFPFVTDLGICKSIFENTLNKPFTDRELIKIKTNFLKMLKENWKTKPELFDRIPNALTFFNHIVGNYPIAIATGGWAETAAFKLNVANFKFHNLPFANSNHHFSRKEITQKAIDMSRNIYETHFSKIVYFGDGKWDLNTCKELGIAFIGIDHAGNGKLKSLGVKKVFSDFRDMGSILNAIETIS